MSLQKAIFAYRRYLKQCIFDLSRNAFSRHHLEHALEEFNRLFPPNHTHQPSEDTPYKKNLTAWIERKARYDWVEPESPYSIFETWQKVCPRTTEEGEG